MVVSQNRGTPIWTKNTIVLSIGTPKREVGNPPCRDVCSLRVPPRLYGLCLKLQILPVLSREYIRSIPPTVMAP